MPHTLGSRVGEQQKRGSEDCRTVKNAYLYADLADASRRFGGIVAKICEIFVRTAAAPPRAEVKARDCPKRREASVRTVRTKTGLPERKRRRNGRNAPDRDKRCTDQNEGQADRDTPRSVIRRRKVRPETGTGRQRRSRDEIGRWQTVAKTAPRQNGMGKTQYQTGKTARDKTGQPKPDTGR